MDKRLLSIDMDIEENPSIAKKESANKLQRVNNKTLRLILSVVVYGVLIPLVIALGIILFNSRKYNIVSIMIAILACVPCFVSFEKGKTRARELVVISVMTAISVLGRIIFAPVPGFKPVTAIVIITAIAYGSQAGFLTGALSAIVSNIFYGQGPWTPFQMFAWGLIGLVAGIIFKDRKKPDMILLIIIGIAGGIVFSFLMDIWSVINVDGGWNWARYSALLVSGVPFTIIYAVSNVVFLLLFSRPFLEKLNRIKDKYGIFER